MKAAQREIEMFKPTEFITVYKPVKNLDDLKTYKPGCIRVHDTGCLPDNELTPEQARALAAAIIKAAGEVEAMNKAKGV